MKKNIIIGMVAVFAMALVASAALAGPGFGRVWDTIRATAHPPFLVNRKPVRDSKSLIQSIEGVQGGSILLLIQRGENSLYFMVAPR